MPDEIISKLDTLSFDSLNKLGIDWRSVVNKNEKLKSKYLDFLNLKRVFITGSTDFSQLEIYVLASLSGDQTLIDAVNNGLDIHSFNTEKVCGICLKSLEQDLKDAKTDHEVKNALAALEFFKAKRKTIKALTFSLSYGAGKEKIASDLRISVEEADKLIKDFYNAYPKIKQWQGKMLLDVIEKGYLETVLGRRRAMPKLLGRMDAYKAFIKEDAAAISKLRRDKEYWSLREEFKQVLNTNIQSLSSDMCSLAACKFKEWLKTANKRAELHFWVHDSIVFSAHIDDFVEVAEAVRNFMETGVKYPGDPVNYRTSLEVGYNYEWASEIKRDSWIAADNAGKRLLIDTHLNESLDSDINKKLKLIIKSTSLALDETYIKNVKESKEEYFEWLVSKLDIEGVYSPEQYMIAMNGCTSEEYEQAMGLSDESDEPESED